MSPQVLNSYSSNIEKNLKVRCEVCCRIPTKNKGEFYVHLYKNNIDDKEHLAIVAGHSIHSKSLNEYRVGDTDEKRMIRGATYQPNKTLESNQINNNLISKMDKINCNVSNNIKSNISTTTTTSTTIIDSNINKNNNNNNLNNESKCEEEQNKSQEHVDPKESIPLVRIHSECFTSETIYSCRCDCAEQLDKAMKKIQDYGNGVIIYLKQEGRNIGLLKKMMAYNLQDQGLDTVEANLKLNQPVDGRNYTIAARILEDLGINSLKLLTNNPDKIKQLSSLGVNVVERIPMIPSIWENLANSNYSSDSNSNFSNDIDDDLSNSLLDEDKYLETKKSPLEPEKLTDLERYLQTKVECMSHDIPLPKHLLHTHFYHSNN